MIYMCSIFVEYLICNNILHNHTFIMLLWKELQEIINLNIFNELIKE